MTQLNILYMTSISINRRNLFVSENSSDFGTATHWILCQIYKSYLSCQNSLMKSNIHLLQYFSMALNASNDTPFNPANFILLRSSIDQLNSSQVIGSSRCHIFFRCLIRLGALNPVGWQLLNTFWNRGCMILIFSLPFSAIGTPSYFMFIFFVFLWWSFYPPFKLSMHYQYAREFIFISRILKPSS